MSEKKIKLTNTNGILKALACDTRREILLILRTSKNYKIDPLSKKHGFNKKEKNFEGWDVTRIAEKLGMSEASISAQTKILEKIGLIEVSYEPGGRGIRKICKYIYDKIIIEMV